MIPLYYYDTCSLLRLQEQAFQEPFWVNSITFQELEEIKTSAHKDEEVKAQARNLLRLFNSYEGLYQCWLSSQKDRDLLHEKGLPETNDNLILIGAYLLRSSDVEFVTDDLSCRMMAQVLGLRTASPATATHDLYKGWRVIDVQDELLAEIYGNMSTNTLSLQTNEYALLKRNGDIVDILKWDGKETKRVPAKTVKTKTLDAIKPKDEYQRCAIDSILSNTMTIIYGRAGSGKSLLALSTALYLVETGKYDRIVILFNPTKARGATDLGFYKGSRIEKAMSNSIGEMLISKFGDRYVVDNLIGQEKIKLVSMADCRGMEVKDNEILVISESQNCSVDLLKLCLSRCSQGCKIIIEGDFKAQVDSYAFEGAKNGMRRAVEKLHGDALVGVVELPNIWRSKIAELVQKM